MVLDREIVLASKSPRRREYLSLLGLEYIADSPDVDENVGSELTPGEQTVEVARKKARALTGKYPDAVIIGADTMVVLGDRRLGKPEDETHARRMLSMLQGNMHHVYTGVCIIDSASGREYTDYACTSVFMDSMDRETIEAYVATGEPMDKAGAYAIQGLGSAYISRIEGCYFNVLGLPVNRIYHMLEKLIADSQENKSETL